MKKTGTTLYKILSCISGFSLVFNSFLPATTLPLIFSTPVYAEDVATQSSEPVQPTEIQTPTPTETITTTPEPTPVITIEPTYTPTPTEEATPSPTPTVEVTPTPTTTEPPHETSPPEQQGEILDGVSIEVTPTENPTATPQPEADRPLDETEAPITGNLSATVLPHVEAASLDLDSVDPSTSATITTDKADYAPTDTAIISGADFKANYTYSLTISSSDEPATSTTVIVTTDESGAFLYAYQLDGTYRPNYAVVVKDSSTIVATTTFTDGPGVNVSFEQCANDAGGSYSPGECKWIGSILQGNNSEYFEGMSVSQRILYQGITTPGAHTITFSYSYTKGGTHAYDFLTSLNQGNDAFSPGVTNLNLCDGLSGGDAAVCSALTALTPVNVGIPHDPFDSKDSAPAPGVGTTQTQKETWYEGNFGSRNIKVYSSNPFSSGTVSLSHSVGANGDTGDSDVDVSLSFNLASCGAGTNACKLLIYFGGHLAVTGANSVNGSDWGNPLGSSNINGGPYHIKNLAFDGNGGSLDNQISGADIILPGTIIINKTTVGSDGTFQYTTTGGSTIPASFDITTSTQSGSQTFTNVLSGTYTITEQVQVSPWSFTSLTCSDPTLNSSVSNRTATIVVAPGETVTCTYTNTYTSPNGTLRVHKVTDPSSDTTTEFDITATGSGTITGAATRTITGGSSVDYTVTAGTYDVDEGTEPGWTEESNTCSNIVVSASQTSECTITNSKLPQLTVTKVVTNDNGGTKQIADFPLFVDGNLVTSGATNTYAAGNYVITETGDPNYVATFSGDCDAQGNVTLANGDNKSCTITNNDNAPSLTLIKTVTNDNGGQASASAWTLTADGPTDISGAGGATSGASFDAGTYTLSESAGPSGYTAGNWNCTGGTQNGASITVELGQTVSCTINNNDVAPTLTVIKQVINDDGGSLLAPAFTMNVTGTNVSDDSFPGDESGTTVTLNAGSYSVDEATVSGYAKTLGANCSGTIALGETKTCTVTNDDQPGTLIVKKTLINDDGGSASVSAFSFKVNGGANESFEADGQNDYTVNAGTYTVVENTDATYATSYNNCSNVVIPNGGTATCTITNDDVAPTLKLTKLVSNVYGGTATSGAWLLDAAGSTRSFNDTGDSATFHTVNAGVSYTLSESGPSGYTEGAWTCDGGTLVNGAITLGLNEHVTCSITNTAEPATLIVRKVVINDNGGTASASAFSFKVNDGSPVSFESDAENSLTVDAGTYSVTEPAVAGYATSYDNCAQVTIPNGRSATCTITNDDIAPSLTLTKHVTNDHGGQAVATDWTLTADGPTDISGPGGATSGATFKAGTYTLSESTGPSGYTPGAWSCTGGTFSNDQVTLGLGESATCEITNDDQLATLIVIKHVENNNIGNNVASDFTMNVTGTDVSDTSFPGDELGTTVTLDAGTYEVTEQTITGYSDSYSTDCDGTILNGQTKTCTVTNSRDTGTIIVNKVLSPENDPGKFNLQIDGTTTGSGENVGDGGTTGTITLGTGEYTVGETAGTSTDLSDYQTSFVCVDENNQNEVVARGTGTTYDELTLGKNQDIVCTFTNTRETGDLQVNKFQDTDGDGDYDTVNSKDFSWGTVAGVTTEDMGQTLNLNTGEYDIYESSKAGYLFTGWYYGNPRENDFSCTNLPENDEVYNYRVLPTHINVAFDQTTEITLCNQFQNPILTITKSNNAAGDKHPGENVLFTLTVTATQSGASNVTVTDLPAGGFSYRTGSWTANSSVRGDLKTLGVTTEPTYHSPGVWNLGDMIVDEVVTLSYIADISGSQEPGLYKDTAWAKGKDLADNTVMANTDSDPTYFVGTEVNIVTDTQFSSSHNVINNVTGEVLGASTELPSTGANTLWLMIAALLLTGGISMGTIAWVLRRRYE